MPIILALLLATMPASEEAAQAPAEGSPAHYFLLKLDREVQTGWPKASTGLAGLDALNARWACTEFRKVFRDPPRGHRNPEAWERIGLGRWYHVDFGRDLEDLDRVVEEYGALSFVEKAQRDRYVQPTVLPNDPDYAPHQWDLKPNRCDAEGAWDLHTDSSDVLVFVIDTGVEVTHSDIADNLWRNPGEIPGNGIDDDLNGYIDDVFGWDFVNDDNTVEDDWPHGMHVNGIIGAVGNNANKVAGINWKCTLAQAKMFASSHGTDEFGAAATVYAADNGAQVINNSWGDDHPVGPIEDAVEYADSLDVLQVAAAGNRGTTDDHYPAVFEEMLAVSSTNSSDDRSSWSTHGDWIDMAAPGESIYNLWIGDSTTWASGTSMASPHVAGAGAMVRSINPQLRNIEARWILRHKSDDIGAPGFDDHFGWGRLDIRQAAVTARSLSLSTTTPNAGDTVTITLDQPDEASMLYVMLATREGIIPGLPLDGIDPSDERVFPLNWDDFFNWQIAVQPNPITQGFFGQLDGQGKATATFATAAIPFFQGETFTVAYLTLDPGDLSTVRFLSAPVSFTVQ